MTTSVPHLSDVCMPNTMPTPFTSSILQAEATLRVELHEALMRAALAERRLEEMSTQLPKDTPRDEVGHQVGHARWQYMHADAMCHARLASCCTSDLCPHNTPVPLSPEALCSVCTRAKPPALCVCWQGAQGCCALCACWQALWDELFSSSAPDLVAPSQLHAEARRLTIGGRRA